MYKFKQLLRKGRVVIATAVLGFGIAAGVAVAESAMPSQTQAASCDKVNVLYCGLKGSNLNGYISSIKNYYNSNKSGHNASPSVKKHYNDVRKVFSHAGASSSDVRGMNTSNTKLGTLYRNGNIKVGGKVVATDAKVAARFSVSGAKKVSGTNVWFRKTTSSFANDQVKVVVHFKYGKMDFAVIKDCGNIVTAKPKVSKGYCKDLSRTIVNRNDRRVKATVKGSTTNASIVDYKIDWGDGKTSGKKSDTHTYNKYGKFTIKGSVKVKYLSGKTEWVSSSKCKSTVEFKKPKPQALACVELDATPTSTKNQFRFTAKANKDNGATISGYTYDFGDGNSDNTNTTSETDSVLHTYDKSGEFTATVHVNGKVDGKSVSKTADKCKVKINIKPPKQTLECVELNAVPTDEKNQFRFVATAETTNGATISGYTFNPGDGSDDITVDTSDETAEALYTYNAEGEYTATVGVDGTVNGQNVTGVTDDACKTNITISPDEVLACVNLTKEDVEGVKNSYVFKAVAQALNGATIASYTFDFGDGSDPVTVDSSSESVDTTYTYDSDGNYTATVTVNGTVDGEEVSVTDAECEVDVTVETPEEPCPENPEVSKDSPKCDEPELPETGAASMLSLFGGISALGTVGHRLYIKRRLK